MIQQDDVIGILTRKIQRFLPGCRQVRMNVAELQEVKEDLSVDIIVIDDQDAGARSAPLLR